MRQKLTAEEKKARRLEREREIADQYEALPRGVLDFSAFRLVFDSGKANLRVVINFDELQGNLGSTDFDVFPQSDMLRMGRFIRALVARYNDEAKRINALARDVKMEPLIEIAVEKE